MTNLTIWLLLGGLFTGQILLIWHYLDFFKRWYGFAIALASYCLLFGTWSYFNNTLHETSRWLSYINAAVSVWLMVSVFTIGIVIFIFLIANDYGLRIMALAALGSMWGLFFLAQQMDGELLFENILTVQLPIFSIMQCITMWLLLAGIITFSGRMLWLIHKEISATISVIQMEEINE